MMTRAPSSPARWPWLATTLIVAACSSTSVPPSDDEPDPTLSTGGGGQGGVATPADGGGGNAADWSASARCPNAPDFEILSGGSLRAEGTLREPGERAHFRFTLPQNAWLAFNVLKPDLSELDAVLRIFDASGQQLLATVDEHRPSFDNYEAMYFSTPYSGDYCAELLTFEDWRGLPTTPVEHDYTLRLTHPGSAWTQIDGFFTQDAEPNETVQEATPISSEDGFLITGGFSDEQDRDVFVASLGPTPLDRLLVVSSPPGPGGDGFPGYGGTTAVRSVSILASDGVTVLAKHDPNDLATNCSSLGLCGSAVAIDELTSPFYVVVERDANAPHLSSEPYSLFAFAMSWGGSGYEFETIDDGTDDVRSGASTLTRFDDIDGYPGYSIDGRLTAGDTDWLHIPELAASESLGVWCSAAQWGSGIVGLRIEAVDADDETGALIQGETEASGSPLLWNPGLDPKATPSMGALPGGRAYHIKVSATGWEADVASRAYFCRFTIQPGGN